MCQHYKSNCIQKIQSWNVKLEENQITDCLNKKWDLRINGKWKIGKLLKIISQKNKNISPLYICFIYMCVFVCVCVYIYIVKTSKYL